MPFLSWRPQYRIGVDLIDQEHRYLFHLINRFHDHHRVGNERSDIEQVLNKLVRYAEQHFRHEEAIMQAESYPAYAAHCELHEQLYLTLYRLSEQLAAGSLRINTDTLHFVRNWLVKHIVEHDLQFADYLTRRAKAGAKEDSQTPASRENK